MIHKIKIAILRGGGSFDHDFSMMNGDSILKNLSEEKYIKYDVILSKDGNWYLNGTIVSPEKLFKQIDLCLNTIKTNGSLEKIMDSFGVKYVGSDSIASSVAGNKHLAKKIYTQNGIKTPYYKLVRKDNYNEKDVLDIFKNTPAPYVVKPALGDFSFNVHFVQDINSLKEKIEGLLKITDAIIVEEFIKGKKVVCNVVDNFREKQNYSFLPTEIIFEGQIFDSESKLNNNFEIISPRLSKFEKEEVQRMAIEAHNFLGLKDCSHSDFIVHPKRGIYILETNPLPDFKQDSPLIKSMELVGIDLSRLLDHIINLSICG